MKHFVPLEIYLYEFLSKYGFNASHVHDIIQALDGLPGKLFHSDKYSLVKDRESLIVYQKNNQKIVVEINEKTECIQKPVALEISTLKNTKDMIITKDTKHACLDMDKLVFPLTLRKWKFGDKFRPLGMKGFKKLSDFFTDIKLSQADKEDMYVIESNGEIVWIVGYRIDDRFKISERTKTIFIINKVK